MRNGSMIQTLIEFFIRLKQVGSKKLEIFVEFPCLSFDVIPDTLGNSRQEFPLTCFLVGGTQAEKQKDNQLVVMRLSNIYGIEKKKDEDDDDDESSDEEEEKEKEKTPLMHAAVIPHFGDVNRVKVGFLNSFYIKCSYI